MSAGSSSGVTQLEFHQAMNDFKNMFPEMEEDVIEAVLRANNGVVDATIDQLLQMNNESLKKKAAMAHKKENLYNQSNLYSVECSTAKDGKSYKKNLQFMSDKISKDSLRYKNRWDPPLLGELSPTFLRISLNETQRKLSSLDAKSDAHLISSSFLQQKMEENERNRQITSLNDDPELAQFLEDERFAILMQNEEFVRELRMNRDFMSTLESDNYSASGANVGEGAAGPSNNYAESDAAFKEKLRNMGKVSKKKFTQLARLFSGRTKKSFKQLDETASRNPYLYEDLNDSLRDVNSAGSSSREARKANIKF